MCDSIEMHGQSCVAFINTGIAHLNVISFEKTIDIHFNVQYRVYC